MTGCYNKCYFANLWETQHIGDNGLKLLAVTELLSQKSWRDKKIFVILRSKNRTLYVGKRLCFLTVQAIKYSCVYINCAYSRITLVKRHYHYINQVFQGLYIDCAWFRSHRFVVPLRRPDLSLSFLGKANHVGAILFY